MPALAWLHQRSGRSASALPAALRVGTVADLAAFFSALAWTATGRSVLDASAGSALLVGLPMSLFLLAAASLDRRHGA